MIPKGWDVAHRPTAEQGMTAQVRVRRHTAQGAVFDPDTGQTTFPDPTTVWTGWARLQRMPQQEVTRSVGDRQVVIRGVVVSIPADTPEVRVSDEVKVLGYRDAGSGDPHLLSRPLWVHDVRPGSLLWQRDLTVLDAPPTAR
jgi:hypothetical protein